MREGFMASVRITLFHGSSVDIAVEWIAAAAVTVANSLLSAFAA